MTNEIDHPSHYAQQGDIECIEVLEQLAADGEDFRILNALKYLWRYRHKRGVDDLRKAMWYIQRRIDKIVEDKPHSIQQYDPTIGTPEQQMQAARDILRKP